MDIFLKLSSFFHDPADVGNLISGSSAFSKTSLNIWKFTVHILLKPGLENMSITLLVCEISFILVIAFFNSVSLFFVFSNSFLKAYNFLLSASVLLPSPLIVFTVITLKCFLGRLPTSTSLSFSYQVLSCSFASYIFLCHLVLSQVLFVFYVCGRLVTFLDFGEVFLCRRHLLHPSSVHSPRARGQVVPG